MRPLIYIAVSFLNLTAFAAPTTITGVDVAAGQSVTVAAAGKRGLVVVFLSAVCPCSNSHMPELIKLRRDYADFAFVGVHANTDEREDQTKTYFTGAHLPFPVIDGRDGKLADEFRALKTPHAFVVQANGLIAYRGGVSDSQDFGRADRKYLRQALSDLRAGNKVKDAETRTLGCAISRAGKHAL
ncbi:MAG TPA: redoxin domain-containing protein [Bdellovibrionales bacterium]|nr:redoxin domain-containing protein [Bdellovibrionales bacterium]